MPTLSQGADVRLHETMQVKGLAWHIVSTQQILDLITWVSFQEGSIFGSIPHKPQVKMLSKKNRQ